MSHVRSQNQTISSYDSGRPAPKNSDELADQLIAQFFLPGDFSCLLPREKEAVRNCIKSAVARTELKYQLEEPQTPVAKAIAKDAENFEKDLPEGTDVTRVKASWMPWGWVYKDEELQKKFRTFCSGGKY